jgi:ribosomal protein S1
MKIHSLLELSTMVKSEIVDKGATVEFGDDIVAFIPTRHLEKKMVRN